MISKKNSGNHHSRELPTQKQLLNILLNIGGHKKIIDTEVIWTGEVEQRLREHTAFAGNLIQFPSSISIILQPPITPAPGV